MTKDSVFCRVAGFSLFTRGMRGELGALIDVCIHLATTDDLHMKFDVIIISKGNKTCTVQFQCTSNSAAIYMMVLKICTGTYFMKTSWILITVK